MGEMLTEENKKDLVRTHVLKKGHRQGQGQNVLHARTKNTLTYRLHPRLTYGQKRMVKIALKELQSKLKVAFGSSKRVLDMLSL